MAQFSLYKQLTVAQNLSFFAGIYGLFGRHQQTRIDAMVTAFALALARSEGGIPMLPPAPAVIARPAPCCTSRRCCSSTEPTSGVDPVTRREFWSHINALADHGVTVLVTTHFMDEAEYCDPHRPYLSRQAAGLRHLDDLKAGRQRGGDLGCNRLLADLFFANNGRGLYHPGRAGQRGGRMSINRRRLLALCRKETLQIVRDPSSILIAFIMPVVLLVVMGYAINLDVDHLRLGIWRTDSGARRCGWERALRGSTALEIHSGPSRVPARQVWPVARSAACW